MDKLVFKNNREKVYFDINLLISSLKRAGASPSNAREIAKKIGNELVDISTTREIYDKAYKLLEESSLKGVAMKYSVKKAIFKLGPTGFPFEKFIAVLFERKGYDAELNVVAKGKCTRHEIDILLIAPKRIAFEAKFHQDDRLRTDTKTVLYVKARFDDLMNSKDLDLNYLDKIDDCVLVTNTKFTTKAIEYASCSGVRLLGWSYPNEENLRSLIEDLGIHPITCLKSLSDKDAVELFKKNIITCKDFLDKCDSINIKNKKVLQEEAELICT